jgi:hypothetical protein
MLGKFLLNSLNDGGNAKSISFYEIYIPVGFHCFSI